MKKILVLTSFALPLAILSAAELPSAEISNGSILAKIYLPDARNGFYRGTRFDWSGVVYSLNAAGHNYYGPWFQKTDPTVHDFIYEGPDIVAGPCSAVTGPVDEFGPVGYDEAKAGGRFIKIGIGALHKPDDAKYDNYRLYAVDNGGTWTIHKRRDSIDFIQEVTDSASGYGYTYRKTIRLAPGKTEMALEHSLTNTGSRAIQTTVYNHNFLVLDNMAPGPGVSITVPFAIDSPRPPSKELAGIAGNKLSYLKTLEGRDVVTTPFRGFGVGAADSRIRIDDERAGAGMTIEADRPLLRESLWSIRSVIAMEPFIAIAVEPGKEFTWKSVYNYYALPARGK